MKAKEYFKKEYGVDHIPFVVELKDFTSLYELMDEYAKRESAELLKALQTIYGLIDRGVLVRDISRDHDFKYFTKQGIEISNAIVLVNEAIKKATH